MIWEQIVKRWESIPIVNVHSVFTPQDVYEAMVEFGESKDGQYIDNTGYYLTRSEMEDICNEYGIPFSTIRVSFESRGLFDKDATTLGYQKSKKIDVYCYRQVQYSSLQLYYLNLALVTTRKKRLLYGASPICSA